MARILSGDDNYFGPLNKLFEDAQFYMFDPKSGSKRTITKDDLAKQIRDIFLDKSDKDYQLEENKSDVKEESKIDDSEKTNNKSKIRIKETSNGCMYLVPVPGYDPKDIHASISTKNNDRLVIVSCDGNDLFKSCTYSFGIKKSLDINTAEFNYKFGVLYVEFKNQPIEDNTVKSFNINF